MVGGQVSYRHLRCNSLGVQMYRIPIQKKTRCTVKSATFTRKEWKMRFLHLTTSYRLTRGYIHDKLYIVSCEL